MTTLSSSVLDETARLLAGLRLATERGASARGAHVSIVVAPRWNPERESFDLAVLCYTPTHDAPGWSGLPIWLDRVPPASVPGAAPASDGLPAPRPAPVPAAGAPQPARAAERALQRVPALLPAVLARLDRRGRAMLRDVPAGEYRLVAGAAWLEVRAPFALPLTATSIDGRLTVSISEAGPAELALDVRGPAGTTAVVGFADAHATRMAGAEIELHSASASGPATGRWQGAVNLDAATALVCQLLRDEDRANAWI